MTFQEVPLSQEWVPGETYRFHFAIDPISVFGYELPRFEQQQRVEKAILTISNDPRLELVSAKATTDDLTIIAKATQAASPVHIIALAIIGLASILGVSLVLNQAGVLVENVRKPSPGIANTGIGAFEIGALGIMGISIILLIINRNRIATLIRRG